MDESRIVEMYQETKKTIGKLLAKTVQKLISSNTRSIGTNYHKS